MSFKNHIGTLMGIALNLCISSGNMATLAIWIFPLHEHGISFHFIVSFRSLLIILSSPDCVAQWVGHCLTKQDISGWIPGRGTCLACRFSPWTGRVWEATNQCSSPSPSPSLPFSLKINKIFKKQCFEFFSIAPSHCLLSLLLGISCVLFHPCLQHGPTSQLYPSLPLLSISVALCAIQAASRLSGLLRGLLTDLHVCLTSHLPPKYQGFTEQPEYHFKAEARLGHSFA